MTPIQLHNHALDAVYAALEKKTCKVCGKPSNGMPFHTCPQRTPEQREAFIRAEMVKDRERKGYE